MTDFQSFQEVLHRDSHSYLIAKEVSAGTFPSFLPKFCKFCKGIQLVRCRLANLVFI